MLMCVKMLWVPGPISTHSYKSACLCQFRTSFKAYASNDAKYLNTSIQFTSTYSWLPCFRYAPIVSFPCSKRLQFRGRKRSKAWPTDWLSWWKPPQLGSPEHSIAEPRRLGAVGSLIENYPKGFTDLNREGIHAYRYEAIVTYSRILPSKLK